MFWSSQFHCCVVMPLLLHTIFIFTLMAWPLFSSVFPARERYIVFICTTHTHVQTHIERELQQILVCLWIYKLTKMLRDKSFNLYLVGIITTTIGYITRSFFHLSCFCCCSTSNPFQNVCYAYTHPCMHTIWIMAYNDDGYTPTGQLFCYSFMLIHQRPQV